MNTVLTAWGNFPPIGIYEGTFGDIGSFHGCVNVPENPLIGHAHYCTISYRPVLAYRKNYELIMRREPAEMLHLFDKTAKLDRNNDNNDSIKNNNNTQANHHTNQDDKLAQQSDHQQTDAFTDLLYNTQYSHYVYYKYGTCFPIQCSPNDVQSLARLLGRRSILMTGPVKCHSKYTNDYDEAQSSSSSSISRDNLSSKKQLQISTRDLNNGVYIWKPHITNVQVISLIIIGSISFIVILLTFFDIVLNRVPSLFKEFKLKQHEELSRTTNGANGKSIKTINALGNAFLTQQVTTTDSDLNNNFELQKLNNSNKVIENNELSVIKQPSNKSLIKQERTLGVKEDDDIMLRNSPEEEVEIRCIINDAPEEVDLQQVRGTKVQQSKQRSLFMTIVDDYSIINNAEQFLQVSENQLKNDILCINGIRCITMSWIIITHTMQYNDWSAFARIREVETHLQSLINQPLFNASYLVDTFFFISGLLTSFSSFKSKGEQQKESILRDKTTKQIINSKFSHSNSLLWEQFSSTSYLIGRYLRLTPQIMLVSLLFILLPLLSRSGGPHWYTITGEYSENCSQNWWVNLFHIQSFYRSNEMCNFVTWWISVDMFYHLFALALILTILTYGHRIGFITCAILIFGQEIIQGIRHYEFKLPPNLLSTIPQTGAMWSQMTLEFFWTPQAHTVPFFLGFYIGYLMVKKETILTNWLTTKRSIFCWALTSCLLVMISYGTYFWVIGKWNYPRLISTIFYLIGPIIWATCLSWTIVACHFGFGGWINQMLSCKLFIILGKASYIVYLSHFLVLFTFFGSQNLLLEPTQLVMFYVIFGNICLSMLFGSILCITFEMPWLKTQKRLMKYVR